MKNLLVLCCMFLVLLIHNTVGYAQETNFNLHLKFIIPYTPTEWPDSTLQLWITPRVQLAEQLFQSAPKLNITYEVKRMSRKGDLDLQSLVFRSNRHFHRYMKREFPIETTPDAEKNGFLPVVISEKFQILRPKKRLCGKAYLPNHIKWFSSHHGIAMKKYCTLSILAHEIGHVLGLKHTYEYMFFRASCHRKYKKGKKGKRFTANYEERTINLMDAPIAGFQPYLNECQKKLAEKERKRYLKEDGSLNYRLLSK